MNDQLPMPISPLTRAQRVAILNLVRRAARAEIMPRFRNLGPGGASQKAGPQDLVTDADRGAEAMIKRGLLQMFPNALVLGEESSSTADLDKVAEAEMAVIVDPVDGTWNFAHGLTHFGVIVAVARFGQPVLGLLYDPVMDDVIMAEADSPAIMVRARSAAQKLKASTGGTVDKLMGYMPLYLLPKDKRAAAAATFNEFYRVWALRCSCHEYRMFAQGHMDFVLGVDPNPWDHVAGTLIAKRAGGHVAMLDGSPYTPATRTGYLLTASDAATWDRIRDKFAFLLEG